MLDNYLNVLYDYKPHERILPQIKKYTLAKQLTIISKHTEIPKIRINDLRHSHASLLIKEGVQAKVIQKRLGHNDIQITLNTYSHLWEGADDEVSDLLNNLSPK